MLQPFLTQLAHESNDPLRYQLVVDSNAFQVTEYKQVTIHGLCRDPRRAQQALSDR